MRLGFGIRRPRRPVLGQELAGDVESVGKDVRSFRKGDRVFAATGIGLGAYAEYICLRENPQTGAIATMPANLSYEEAAAVPYGGGEALQFLRKANVRSGQRVLVNGAGGSFGTFAVQLAKVLGAHVTAVDSAPKLEMLRAIGADRVIDYSQEDFTDGSETYDVIFDVVRDTPSGRMVRSLNENGCLLMANPGFLQIVRARWASRGSKKRVCSRHRVERARTWLTCETWSKRESYARSSTGAFRWSRWSRLTGTPRPGRSWGTSSSPSRSRGRDRQLLGVKRPAERRGTHEGSHPDRLRLRGRDGAQGAREAHARATARCSSACARPPRRRRVLRHAGQAVPDTLRTSGSPGPRRTSSSGSTARESSKRSART